MKKKLPLIIISFLFAVIIWISVVLGNSFIYKIKVPLKPTLSDYEYAIKGALPSDIYLNVNAQGWKLLSIMLSKDLVFRCELPSKENSFKYQLSSAVAENQWLGADVKILDLTPSVLQVDLDKKTTKRVKVVAGTDLQFKKGYGLARNIELYPDSVTLIGAKATLSKISEVPTDKLELTDLSGSFIERVGINVPNEIDTDPTSVKVYGDVQKIVDREIQYLPITLKNAPKDKTVLFLPEKVSVSVTGGINYLGKITAEDFSVFIDYNDILSDTLGSVSPTVVPPKYVRLSYLDPERIKYIIKKY